MKVIGYRFVFDVLITYILLIISFVLAYKFDSYFNIIILSVFNGLLLHRLGLFIHAAAHRDFSKNDKVLNDLIYNLSLGWFFGVDIEAYRKKHWAHHKNHGTKNLDPEDTYSKGLRKRYLYERFLPSPPELVGDKPPFTLIRVIAYFVHIALFFIFSLGTQSFIKATLYYLLPVFFYLPFITHIRNCLEHSPIKGENSITRSFKTSPTSFFLGAAGFKFHKEHHDKPNIQYWLLEPTNPRVSYLSVLIDLIRRVNA